MGLLGLGIAAAGLYGLAMAWTEMSTEAAKKALHRIEAQEGHVDVIKHFEKILAMVEVKPIDGVIPKDGYKECQDLLMLELMYVTEKDLQKFKKHYNKVRNQQIKNRGQRRKREMKELEKYVNWWLKQTENTDYKRYDRKNSYENEKDVILRCERLYKETPWRKIAKGPAKVIKTPNGKVKEMWMVRRHWKPYGEPYRKCCKVLGYDVY